MWVLNRTKGNPLYKQITHLIEQLLDSGQLQTGERLPSERQLSELLKVNRSTIIHALEDLSDRGVLIRKVGSGTYVNNEKWGLQSSPLINWQASPSVFNTQRQDAYTLQTNQLRQQQIQSPIFDLANGDLPKDLYPTITLPELSWQELLHQEQSMEASHQGLTAFRKTVQDHLRKQFNMDIPLEQILITSGTQQAIFLITQGLLKPGDAIGIEAPSYFYALPLFQATGLRIYAIPTDREGITMDGLDKLLLRQPLKMIFLNPVFQNPTGYVMTEQRKKQLLKYCLIKRIPIVEDDAYSAISFQKNIETSPIKKLDKRQQVIYVGSLSKYIGKNIRAGWLIAPKAIVNKLANIRQQLDSGLSVLPQILAQHYLNHYSATHFLTLQTTLLQRANNLIEWLNTHYKQQLIFYRPLGGYHLYAKLVDPSPTVLNKILNDLLTHRIIVTRGTEFGDTPHHLRFSYGHFNIAPN